MPDFVTKELFLDRLSYFLSGTDKRYIHQSTNASASVKGGVKIGSGLEMDGDTLNATGGGSGSYSLQPATATRLGGIKVGNGLSVNNEGTLDVTLSGGSVGSAQSDFTGATSTTDGRSGLVPKPYIADRSKFLRGDGNWVTINEVPSSLTPAISNIQGAIWQEVHYGAPYLNFRYGNYIYTFSYDSIKFVGDSVTPLNTTEPDTGHILSTRPPTLNSGVWYELNDYLPTLKLRLDDNKYNFNYDAVTYKGDKTNLISYVPCDTEIPCDAIISDNLISKKTYTDVIVVDSNYSYLYPESTDENPVTPLFGKAYTAMPGVANAYLSFTYNAGLIPSSIAAGQSYTEDCWIFFNQTAITKAAGLKAKINIVPYVFITTDGKLQFYVDNGNFTALTATEHANKRHHVAITCKLENGKPTSRLYFDGKRQLTVTNKAMRFFPSGGTHTFKEYVAFNKIRRFNTLLWEGETFEPPTLADYL